MYICETYELSMARLPYDSMQQYVNLNNQLQKLCQNSRLDLATITRISLMIILI